MTDKLHDFEEMDWAICVDDHCWYDDVALGVGRFYWVALTSYSAIQLFGMPSKWFDACKFRKATDDETAAHLKAMEQEALNRSWGFSTEPAND